MKESNTGAVGPLESEHTEKDQRQVGSLDLSLEQIEKRALAQTAVLTEILAEEETSYRHHEGLNE